MPDALAALAADVARHAHVPYSRVPVGAAVRLADGRSLAAPRLENASFPLTIPALVGVWARATLAGAAPVGVVLTRAFTTGERAFLEEWAEGWRFPSAREAVREATAVAAPAVAAPLSGIEAALRAAAGAVVPASGFHVGAVVEADDGRTAEAANVEHALDWTRGLCAERVALVAARAAGLLAVRRVTVACASSPGGTPCGGCRQVLAELAPAAEVVIWRGADAPDVTTVAALLPGAFRGEALGT